MNNLFWYIILVLYIFFYTYSILNRTYVTLIIPLLTKIVNKMAPNILILKLYTSLKERKYKNL